MRGWLRLSAVPEYPVATMIPELPEWRGRRHWLRYAGRHLVAFRAPTQPELAEAREWCRVKSKELEAAAQRAKAARQAFALAPLQAIADFEKFLEGGWKPLVALEACPICGAQGFLEPRAGRLNEGSDATWWANCTSNQSGLAVEIRFRHGQAGV